MTKSKSFIGPRQAFLNLPRITSKASFSKKVALATLLALPAGSTAFAFFKKIQTQKEITLLPSKALYNSCYRDATTSFAKTGSEERGEEH